MRKTLMVFVAAGFLLAGMFVYFRRPLSCSAIMEQTTQKMILSVDAVKATGAVVIGGEKVQDISEGARKIGEHLTACCAAKPWDEAKAVIKLKTGKTVTVDAKQVSTDSYCGGGGLILDYGQSIPFKNMQSFSVTDDKPTIEIVVLDGELLSGGVGSLCHIYAVNEFGDFKTGIGNIERVDFGR